MTSISFDTAAYNITLQYLTYKLVLNPIESVTNPATTISTSKLMKDYIQNMYFNNGTTSVDKPPSLNYFMFRTDSESCYEYDFNNILMKQSLVLNTVPYTFMIFECGFINVLDYFGSGNDYYKCDKKDMYLFGATVRVNNPFKLFSTSMECINFLSKENAKNPGKISRFCCIQTNDSYAIRHRTLQQSNKKTSQCYSEEVTFCIDKYYDT